MSTFVPNYEDAVSHMPNCLCGESGKNRDVRVCNKRQSCDGCGFDRDEYRRRINIIRRGGLREISFKHKSDLIHKYGIRTDSTLRGISVGKGKSKGSG